jgi:hypothetical protein
LPVSEGSGAVAGGDYVGGAGAADGEWSRRLPRVQATTVMGVARPAVAATYPRSVVVKHPGRYLAVGLTFEGVEAPGEFKLVVFTVPDYGRQVLKVIPGERVRGNGATGGPGPNGDGGGVFGAEFRSGKARDARKKAPREEGRGAGDTIEIGQGLRLCGVGPGAGGRRGPGHRAKRARAW